MLPGISGTLISTDFLERTLFQQFGDALTERAAARRAVVRWWRTAERCHGPASSVRLLLDGAAIPLAEALGFRVMRTERVHDLFVVSLTNGASALPMLVVPWQSRLDSFWRLAVRYGLLHHSGWCLLYSGSRLRVLDVAHGHAQRCVEFDLPTVLGHDASSDVLAALVRRETLDPRESSDNSLLAQIVSESDQVGVRVCSALRLGVVTATERMLVALVRGCAGPDMAHITPAELQDEAMTAVYRMLFLLFAEARTLVPSWHAVYRRAYSLEALRDTIERQNATPGISEALQAIGRLAHAGCHAGDLVVTAFNGRLFSPARAPRLDSARLDDECVRQAVLAVSSFIHPGENRRQRIAFADLGVEELGGVYEGLLEYEARLDPAPDPKATRRAPRPRVVARLERTGRARRKATGTFYTPRPLTRYLVRETLEPLVRGRTAEEILALRICDPAMGSGAFLVATCRYLARAYEVALLETGSCAATDLTEHDRAGFRRLVAQRCLFGVDLNPMAVQLARLSLWLTTLAADQPLTFLDHHLVVGDSLVGASPGDLLRFGRARAVRQEHQLPLFDASELSRVVSIILPVRHQLERTADTNAASVRAKEVALASLDERGDLRRWRTACDVWCSSWCSERPLPPGTLRALLDEVLHGPPPLDSARDAMDDGQEAVPASRSARDFLDHARRGAVERAYQHWALRFPEVFCDERGTVDPGLGFDAIIGNPPWEMLRADAAAKRAPSSRHVLRFARASGLYTSPSVGHSNQYQLFVERALTLLRHDGRFGLVVPGGLALDASAAALRRRLVCECDLDGLVGFENRNGVFPIHRSTRFLLMTGSRGGRTERIRCRFGLQDPSELDALSDQTVGPRDRVFPVSMDWSLLDRLSGDDLAIPYVRTPRDLQITERLWASWPRLDAAAGWGARFGRELNATDHRGHFTCEPRGLPVLEGKHVMPYQVNRDGASLWIPRRHAARLLDAARTFEVERLAYRDVASASNRQTVIAAILPQGCVSTHTLFCLKTRLALRDQRVLCVLLNSHVVNFLVRQRVSTHVTLAVMHTIPVPRPAAESLLYGQMCDSAARLAGEPNGSEAVLARAQALTACAYALGREDYEHILSTFPLVSADERRLTLDEFMRLRQRGFR